jgi:hypothetical protein
MPSERSADPMANGDVRSWHAADIDPLQKDVRFQVQSGHQVKAHRCLGMTHSGHQLMSRQRLKL